jgi:hypothetical protein
MYNLYTFVRLYAQCQIFATNWFRRLYYLFFVQTTPKEIKYKCVYKGTSSYTIADLPGQILSDEFVLKSEESEIQIIHNDVQQSRPKKCSFKFLLVEVEDEDSGKKFKLDLTPYYMDGNVITKNVIVFLVKDQHGFIIKDTYIIQLIDHHVELYQIFPSQSIVLHQHDYKII